MRKIIKYLGFKLFGYHTSASDFFEMIGKCGPPIGYATVGLCSLRSDHYWFHVDVIEIARGWPYHSGDDVFPVPARSGSSPEIAYYACGNKYKGAYGRSRKDLALFIADYLKDLGM